MRFRTTPAFDRDWKRLLPEHKAIFRERMPEFSRACDAHAAAPGSVWPAALRVSQMKGTKSIWEMTWSFAGPDGRATFEFVTVDGDLVCQWRRVGDHSVYINP
ncbi:MAG: hypothetical protein JJD92_09210 [Frankiaceae bacterium]|nr:hypothetical protein [Frankiaceae bacterium]